jgi:hypothetical protein
MLQINRRQFRSLLIAAASVLLTLLASTASTAQSGDANYPTPVFANEVVGRISPRDVGDPRRTSHFYTFRGTEGDLSVTFDSTELTGDVDVFTATTLRPLLKITLLGDAAHVTKSFYIRSEETLVLRVQARAVGDAEGTYRVTFGGSFEPAPPELANSQQPSAPTVKETESRDRNARRATSTGARIEEPVAAPSNETAKEAKPAPPPAATPSRRTTSSAARSRASARNAPRRTRSTAPTPQAGATKSETGEAKNTGTSGESSNGDANSAGQPSTETNGVTNSNESAAATPPKPAPATRRRPARTTRRSAGESGPARADSGGQPSNAPATSEPLPKQRLLIITKSGTMIERDMDTVRRVTVENNQVVVVTKDGKIIREPLANVLKMSIEP